jgi:hypothetical protein
MKMDFFKLFGKKKTNTASIEEAMKMEKNSFAKREEGVLEAAHNASINACDELQNLDELFKNLAKKEVTDELAKKQKALVDRFCAIGGEQISGMLAPEKNVKETKEFLEKCIQLTERLGKLSPREALRIKFFFEADFSKISEKVREINTITKNGLESFAVLDKHKLYENTEAEIIATELNLEEKTNELERIESKLSSLNEINQKLEKEVFNTRNEMSGYEQKENEIEKKEKSISATKQEIDTYISVNRLLKRLKHDSFMNDELLDLYIQSPSSALMKDEKLRIMDFIKEALTLPIEDRRLIEKAKMIDKNKLALMRNNLVKTHQSIEIERAVVKEKLSPIKTDYEKQKTKKEYTEKELSETEKNKNETTEQVKQLKKNLSYLYEKRKNMLEELLEIKIK